MPTKPPKAPSAKNLPTPDQRRARAEMRILSAAWNDLTEEQRLAWDLTARKDRRGGLAARLRRRSGRRAFFKANFRRLALREGLLTNPPGAGNACSSPLARLVITNRGGQLRSRSAWPLATPRASWSQVGKLATRAPWSGRSSSGSACCLPPNGG